MHEKLLHAIFYFNGKTSFLQWGLFKRQFTNVLKSGCSSSLRQNHQLTF